MIIEVPLALIIALAAANSGAVVALIGVVVFLALRVGRLPTREDHNELRNELKADNAQLREEFRADNAQLREEFRADNAQLREEFRADNAQLREEFRADNAQLREEFRRSHQQIMLALVNHSHRDDGQAVFTLPPEMEITPAPADD